MRSTGVLPDIMLLPRLLQIGLPEFNRVRHATTEPRARRAGAADDSVSHLTGRRFCRRGFFGYPIR